MTICAVYIGDLQDPSFKWEGGDWNDNVPRALSDMFPPTDGHYNACYHEWSEESGFEPKQTDFGGWVVRVSKAQLLSYVEYCYKSEPSTMNSLRTFIDSLDEAKQYALVATEF